MLKVKGRLKRDSDGDWILEIPVFGSAQLIHGTTYDEKINECIDRIRNVAERDGYMDPTVGKISVQVSITAELEGRLNRLLTEFQEEGTTVAVKKGKMEGGESIS